MPDAYPLAWPEIYPRAQRRKSSNFKTSLANARDGLLGELRLMRARNVVVSTNIATYRRGGIEIPYADQSQAKDDPGVAVYFEWQEESYALACDRWRTVADNMQAIRKTVEAMRGIDRWGVSEMLKRSFMGFKALPEAEANGTGEKWWSVLGVSSAASTEDIKRAYRKQATTAHPDQGGSTEAWVRLQEAYEQGLAAAEGV